MFDYLDLSIFFSRHFQLLFHYIYLTALDFGSYLKNSRLVYNMIFFTQYFLHKYSLND